MKEKILRGRVSNLLTQKKGEQGCLQPRNLRIGTGFPQIKKLLKQQK